MLEKKLRPFKYRGHMRSTESWGLKAGLVKLVTEECNKKLR